jgi:gamma-glutamylcyclotransferase (GGCT)/AIG2-like uncharacterized protein YtfP
MFNHKRYQHYLQFVSTEILFGFKLFALPDYPIAIKTESNVDSIVVEIFKIKDLSIESEIHEMEIDAGYYLDIIEWKNTKCGIYLFESHNNWPAVPDGDWVKYFVNRKNTE